MKAYKCPQCGETKNIKAGYHANRNKRLGFNTPCIECKRLNDEIAKHGPVLPFKADLDAIRALKATLADTL